MTPDYEAAATKALETLIKNNICTTPVIPLPVFKRMPGVGVLSFTEMSNMASIERRSFMTMLGENVDAITLFLDHPKMKYVIGYNQRLPFYMLQRGLARELGHIILGHDGKARTSEVRMAEAYCFAHHFLCPRPLIQAVRDSGIRFTVEVLGNLTGCYEQCLDGMRMLPGVRVDPDLNRKVRSQFENCLTDFLSLQSYLSRNEHSALADFGTYMDLYEE